MSTDGIDKLLVYFMYHLHFKGELCVGEVGKLAIEKGIGAEYVSCHYDVSDEDYKEGFVTLYFWKPALDEDKMIIVENKKFYEALLAICEKHMMNSPKDKENLMAYLNKIKKDLGV